MKQQKINFVLSFSNHQNTPNTFIKRHILQCSKKYFVFRRKEVFKYNKKEYKFKEVIFLLKFIGKTCISLSDKSYAKDF
jgi:hypothetical protein